MPEDLPKAVMILIWLLSGTIAFGALLMQSGAVTAVIFALFFFGLPVLVYRTMQSRKS